MTLRQKITAAKREMQYRILAASVALDEAPKGRLAATVGAAGAVVLPGCAMKTPYLQVMPVKDVEGNIVNPNGGLALKAGPFAPQYFMIHQPDLVEEASMDQVVPTPPHETVVMEKKTERRPTYKWDCVEDKDGNCVSKRIKTGEKDVTVEVPVKKTVPGGTAVQSTETRTVRRGGVSEVAGTSVVGVVGEFARDAGVGVGSAMTGYGILRGMTADKNNYQFTNQQGQQQQQEAQGGAGGEGGNAHAEGGKAHAEGGNAKATSGSTSYAGAENTTLIDINNKVNNTNSNTNQNINQNRNKNDNKNMNSNANKNSSELNQTGGKVSRPKPHGQKASFGYHR